MSGPLFEGKALGPDAHPRGRRVRVGPEDPIARVALPVPIEPLDTLFDYAVPPALGRSVRAGCRVVVRFAGRPLTGVVFALARGSDRALEAIEQLVDEDPALSAALLGDLQRIAESTLCPLGIALAAALPAGSAPRTEREVRLTPRGRQALRSGAVRGEERRLLELLNEKPRSPATLARRVPKAGPILARLERDRLIARHSRISAPTARRAQIRVASVPEGLDVERICAEDLARAPRQAQLLRQLAEAKETPTAALDATQRGAATALRALQARGFALIAQREVSRSVFGAAPERDQPATLTDDQRRALEAIVAAIERRDPRCFLLHGITGSGKTEVYLQAIARALDAGRQALVLVPEITLTHQIVARLRARFGDAIAVLHSGLSAGERLEQWERLRRSEVPIAVGARSALFAPLENLGVIVIDEEHDPAYKNEEGLRYHAHDLARLRSRSAQCPVVLGSATPGLETRHAAECGSIERLSLPRRIADRPLPAVEIIDLAVASRRERDGKRVTFSRVLRRALTDTLACGGQAIVFLNRRGFSTQVLCFDCGTAERCLHCDVALVYHASQQMLRCHYCDYAKPPPSHCSGCGAPDAALLGLGTERLEEELRTLLPGARIARLDRDTASRKGYTESVLEALRSGSLDVLVGTQIVAKGHDFPGVRLVGVVAADTGLHLPDFRAAERCFQLLTQVAGRAGRDVAPGRVIVQTFVPEHYAIAPVIDHDYERFYATEIEHRRALGFPPFGHLALALVSSESEAEALAGGQMLADAVAVADRACDVIGPMPAPLSRLRGRYRVQVIAKGSEADAVRAAAIAFQRAAAKLPRSTRAVVDAKPMSML